MNCADNDTAAGADNAEGTGTGNVVGNTLKRTDAMESGSASGHEGWTAGAMTVPIVWADDGAGALAAGADSAEGTGTGGRSITL